MYFQERDTRDVKRERDEMREKCGQQVTRGKNGKRMRARNSLVPHHSSGRRNLEGARKKVSFLASSFSFLIFPVRERARRALRFFLLLLLLNTLFFNLPPIASLSLSRALLLRDDRTNENTALEKKREKANLALLHRNSNPRFLRSIHSSKTEGKIPPFLKTKDAREERGRKPRTIHTHTKKRKERARR